MDAYLLAYALCKCTRSSATAEKQRVSCPHGGRGGPSSPLPAPPLATPIRMVESESHIGRTSSVPCVKRTLKINRAFKVIQGHPYWCRHESRTVCYRNVQLLPTLFRKLTKIWEQEHSKFVDFNDPTHV